MEEIKKEIEEILSSDSQDVRYLCSFFRKYENSLLEEYDLSSPDKKFNQAIIDLKQGNLTENVLYMITPYKAPVEAVIKLLKPTNPHKN